MSCLLHFSMHRPYRFLATRSDDQYPCLQGDPMAYASLNVREEMRVVAGQIVAASPWPLTCSQIHEFSTVPGQEDYRHTVTNFLFTWYYSVGFFLYPKLTRIIKEGRFVGVEAIKRVVTTEVRSISKKYFQQCIKRGRES